MSSAEIWIVASTIIFIALVWKPAKKALISGLDSRRDSIVRELDEAHRLRLEAEALLAEAKARHQSAAKDAEGIVAFARDEAVRLRTEAEFALREHVARREKQALDRIAQAEASAIAEIRGTAVDLAVAASGELLGQKLVQGESDRLLDEVIAALPSRIAGGR